jgi:hypothetical protein
MRRNAQQEHPMHMTDDECRAAWADGLPEKPPILYRNISQTQLSIARYSDRADINGQRYIYTEADELIRADVLKWLRKRRKAEAQKRAHEPKAAALLRLEHQ